MENPNLELKELNRWKRTIPKSILDQAEKKRGRKRKVLSPVRVEEHRSVSREESLNNLIKDLVPPCSPEDVLRDVERVVALSCPGINLVDKCDLILAKESFSEFHEAVKLLKGRRRSSRSKTGLGLDVSKLSRTQIRKPPLFNIEAYEKYLDTLLQIPSLFVSDLESEAIPTSSKKNSS